MTQIDGIPGLAVSWTETAPLEVESAATQIYTGLDRNKQAQVAFSICRLNGCDVLRFATVADFYVCSTEVTCHLLDENDYPSAELYLLGPVLSYWLERQGIPTFHGSAVVLNGQAVGFLASCGSGKSSLAASFVAADCALLTDDLLAIQVSDRTAIAHPTFPQMRLWPTEAQHFLGHWRDLERMELGCEKRRVPIGPGVFGAFAGTAKPLRCVYLPERRATTTGQHTVDFVPVPPQNAFIELVRRSMTARIAETLLQPGRISLLAGIVRQVPVRRLSYPSGLDLLPVVRDAILGDLDSLRDDAF